MSILLINALATGDCYGPLLVTPLFSSLLSTACFSSSSSRLPAPQPAYTASSRPLQPGGSDWRKMSRIIVSTLQHFRFHWLLISFLFSPECLALIFSLLASRGRRFRNFRNTIGNSLQLSFVIVTPLHRLPVYIDRIMRCILYFIFQNRDLYLENRIFTIWNI